MQNHQHVDLKGNDVGMAEHLRSNMLLYDLFFYFQSVTNEDVTQEELGGAKTHTTVSGTVKL